MMPAWLDPYLPPRGPCAFCGDDDARHRTVDAIIGRCAAFEPVDEVANDYGVPVAIVERIVKELGPKHVPPVHFPTW